MRWLIRAVLLFVIAAPAAEGADMHDLSLRLPSGATVLYGLSVPETPAPADGHPLVLALHPGGQRMRYYGSAYARAIVMPALAPLDAVIVAPDCPGASWAADDADRMVMALLDTVLREHRIDRKRVLVVGYSMGGRGTWFMASHHRDLFTAAIPMAASTGNDAQETLATMPTYVIHSRRDEVVPFGPAERTARALADLGRRIRFEALDEPTHYQMGAYVPALRRALEWVRREWERP